MWHWFNCYLTGRHEFGVWCAPGKIFLRCVHCGKRTSGIAIEPKLHAKAPQQMPPPVVAASARVVQFSKSA